MSTLRGLPMLVLSALIETVRSRATLAWNLAFPLLFLFIFGTVFGRSDPETVSYLMPGLLTITVLSASFMGLSMRTVSERENGILRRYRVMPVSAATVVLAKGLTTFCTIGASLVVQLLVARAVFHVTIACSPAVLALVLALILAAFIPLGLFVGSVARDTRSAPLLTNLIFMPMMFLSGAAFPFPLLPAFLKGLARLLPATYAVEALQAVIVRGQALSHVRGTLLVLAATALVGIALDALLFRWESTEPVGRTRFVVALVALVALFSGAAALAPRLEMTRFPAAAPPKVAASSSPEMDALAFLSGTWKGEGWFEPTPGARRPFAITERVQQKLDGQVLQIEGTGTARLPGAARDTTVHATLALVSYDASTGRYRLETHRAGDRARLAEGSFADGSLVWGFRDPQSPVQVRFTIRLTSEGRWLERGETSRDGATWQAFLEMTLERQS